MTGDDFQRIEAELGITLPAIYKDLLAPFPVSYLRGNADTDLWDDADQLIARNRELRTEFVRGHQPWPDHWFFIGDPQTACGNAIDLRVSAAPVLWVDHCDLRTIEGASGEPFQGWLRKWTAAVSIDLLNAGIDPDGGPPPIEPSPKWKRVLGVTMVLFVVALMIGGFVFLIAKAILWLVGST